MSAGLLGSVLFKDLNLPSTMTFNYLAFETVQKPHSSTICWYSPPQKIQSCQHSPPTTVILDSVLVATQTALWKPGWPWQQPMRSLLVLSVHHLRANTVQGGRTLTHMNNPSFHITEIQMMTALADRQQNNVAQSPKLRVLFHSMKTKPNTS